MSESKRHCCAYCGADMGEWNPSTCDRNDTCGERECEQWSRDSARQEHEEAHEQLDRDMGWS